MKELTTDSVYLFISIWMTQRNYIDFAGCWEWDKDDYLVVDIDVDVERKPIGVEFEWILLHSNCCCAFDDCSEAAEGSDSLDMDWSCIFDDRK